MEIHRSARGHGVADDDIRHVVENFLYFGYLDGEPPLRVLYLGPDRAGNLREVVAIERDDGTELVIHAMKMQPRYEDLLPIELRDE